MPEIHDSFTTQLDPTRVARIPDLQAACRRAVEDDDCPMLVEAVANAVDAVLSWLDGEQPNSLLPLATLREAARA